MNKNPPPVAPGQRHGGASALELLIALPIFVLFILVTAEFSLMHQAKSVLDMAALAAARAGAIHGGDKGVMRNAAVLALAPLYTDGAGTPALVAGYGRALADGLAPTHTVGATSLTQVPGAGTFNGAPGGVPRPGVTVDILSPTHAMVEDFGVMRGYLNGSDDATRERVIPNDNLTYRSTAPGANSGANVQDANLLKIRVTHLYKLKMPLVHYFFTPFLNANLTGTLFGGQAGAIGPAIPAPDGYRVPLVAYATVRMQSDFKLASLTGEGAPPPAAPDPGGYGGGDAGSGGDAGEGDGDGDGGNAGAGSGLSPFDEGTITGEGESGATAGGAGDNATACNLPESVPGCGCVGGNAGGMDTPAGGGGSLLDGALARSGQAPPGEGMMRAAIQSRIASLALTDTPLTYRPAKGPAVPLTFTYSQREGHQPAVFGYGNLGPKWTYTGITYLVDDPNEPGARLQHYLPGGGTRFFGKADYDPGTRRFARDIREQSVLVLVATNPIRYERQLADGGLETYAHSDGQDAFPRRIFLTQKKDPAGNALTYHYDRRHRLTHLVDGSNQETLLEYRHADPLKITGIVDPAGKRARIDYDERGRLIAITDAVGLISRVGYRGEGTFIDTLTTPYGVSRFAFGEEGARRWVEITNPLGHTERVEVRDEAPGIAPRELPSPFGIHVANRDLHRRNTYYWDAAAWARHRGDYTKAQIRHWLIGENPTDDLLESFKAPLESRIWYNYPNQPGATRPGTCARPSAIARVLPDGDTQLTRMAYNERGRLTRKTDPLGRETRYEYAPNGIDLVKVQQKNLHHHDTLAQISWDERHRPVSITDAAGQTTHYTWNEAGQLASRTGPLGGTTRHEYDEQGRLTRILNPLGRAEKTYAHDAAGNITRETDSEGHTLRHEYDGLNRRTKTTHPDGTTTEYTWDKLDLVKVKDRNNSIRQYQYDGARNLVAEKAGPRTIRYGYDEAGRRTRLIDGNGQLTTWQYDLQGRLVAKTTADGASTRHDYDLWGRQVRRTDALGQERHLTYGMDDTVLRITYRHSRHPTAEVRFSWDESYPRLTAMEDGTGVTRYTYGHTGAPGALMQTAETFPGGDAFRRLYDKANRVAGWRLGPEGEDHIHDELGRIVGNRNALGRFEYAYQGDTDRLAGMTLAGSPLGREYDYEAAGGDHRLKRIGQPEGARSFAYETAPEHLITALTETARGQSRTWRYGYDPLERLQSALRDDGLQYRYTLDAGDNLTAIAGPAGTENHAPGAGNRIVGYKYDANGNRIEDERHTYQWDAENRLIGIGYKGAAHRKTEFRYDGEHRRTAIIETHGQTRRETRYTWCGDDLCRSRDDAGRATHYFWEGRYIPAPDGIAARRDYYARDHLGSVRDMLDGSGRNLGRYDYDPYGGPIGNAEAPPEFGYAGMHHHAPSGLYLTKYRAYDPRTGRWLSKDPIEEAGGINLYGYVGGNPVTYTDVLGLQRGARPPGGGRRGIWREPTLTDLRAGDLLREIYRRGIDYSEVRDPNRHYTAEDIANLEEVLRNGGYTPPGVNPGPPYTAPRGGNGNGLACMRPEAAEPSEPVYGRMPGRTIDEVLAACRTFPSNAIIIAPETDRGRDELPAD